MRTLTPSPLLRLGLRLDAVLSLAAAVAVPLLMEPLVAALGLGRGQLAGLAALMFGWAGLTGWMGGQPRLTRWVVWLAIVGNLGWAVASLLLPLLGAFSPSPLGWGLLITQALAVLLFAELQWLGLRRSLLSPAISRIAGVH